MSRAAPRSLSPALRMRSRGYAIAAQAFEVTTKDGVLLRGHRLPGGHVALVFCHGFMGWHQKDRLVRLQEDLAAWFTVYAFDFRGHGRSGGLSSFGAVEELDVEAVVGLARQDGFERVVTVGGSMGGIAAIRHAALFGGVDGVVAMSTPAAWEGHGTTAVRRMTWFTSRPAGRRALRAAGVRVTDQWDEAPSPLGMVDRIAPVPLVIVHGRDDHFFDEEQAWMLYRRAREPKRLLLAARFGHAEDGYTPAFALRLAGEVERIVEGAG